MEKDGYDFHCQARFEFGPNANTDRLIFMAATETRVVRLLWEIERAPQQDSFGSYPAMAAVPEPSTYAMIGGVLALGFAVWRRRR